MSRESELPELPGRLRALLHQHHPAPETLSHLAQGLQAVLDELGTDSSGDELRRASSQLRAYITHSTCMLESLLELSGELKSLAWLAEAGGLGQPE